LFLAEGESGSSYISSIAESILPDLTSWIK